MIAALVSKLLKLTEGSLLFFCEGGEEAMFVEIGHGVLRVQFRETPRFASDLPGRVTRHQLRPRDGIKQAKQAGARKTEG